MNTGVCRGILKGKYYFEDLGTNGGWDLNVF
jgi:hypothetical protein